MNNDADAHWMAAFIDRPRDDRSAFAAHWARVLANPGNTIRTVDVDGTVAGYVLSFAMDSRRECGYWIARPYWGRGIATEALRQFLGEETTRPLVALVAADNIGSRTVLERNGFIEIDRVVSFAPARKVDIEEIVFELR